MVERGRPNVVAFQTRIPLHSVHEELTKRAIERVDGVHLLYTVVGLTKPGEIDHFTRFRTYQVLTKYYDPDRILLALIPLAMRMGRLREALWHALIRRNNEAKNHLIVGGDHAGPGNDSSGNPFYGPYDAQALVADYAEELGVNMVPFERMVYVPDEDRYEEEGSLMDAQRTASISGTQVREEYLAKGRPFRNWVARPEVADVLQDAYPPRRKQGICLWSTGLSGSGKSTTAKNEGAATNGAGLTTMSAHWLLTR